MNNLFSVKDKLVEFYKNCKAEETLFSFVIHFFQFTKLLEFLLEKFQRNDGEWLVENIIFCDIDD